MKLNVLSKLVEIEWKQNKIELHPFNELGADESVKLSKAKIYTDFELSVSYDFALEKSG